MVDLAPPPYPGHLAACTRRVSVASLSGQVTAFPARPSPPGSPKTVRITRAPHIRTAEPEPVSGGTRDVELGDLSRGRSSPGLTRVPDPARPRGGSTGPFDQTRPRNREVHEGEEASSLCCFSEPPRGHYGPSLREGTDRTGSAPQTRLTTGTSGPEHLPPRRMSGETRTRGGPAEGLGLQMQPQAPSLRRALEDAQ